MTDLYEGSELEEATREYVARLKDAYPSINEQDLYRLVLDVARRRVEEAGPARPAETEGTVSRAVHTVEPAEGSREDVENENVPPPTDR